MENDLLAQANFNVACSHCHKVFHASSLEHFLEEDETATAFDPDPELEELLAEIEETLAGLEQLEAEKAPPRASLPAALDTDIPPEMAELQAQELPPEFLPASTSVGRKQASVSSYLLALGLSLLLLGQLAWVNRDVLLARPEIHTLAEQLCPYIGCTLPAPPANNHFSLVDHRFEAASHQTYRLRLLIRNDGKRAEPPPPIQITFTDDQQRVVARRTLEAPVYLQQPSTGITPLEPGEILELELTLAVPAGPVTGYEIEFIPHRA
jgi:hypothetical protein